MRWLLIILLLPLPGLHAQGVNARGVVESAEISGVGENDISPDVREAVHKLAGQPFDQHAADDLVLRIQNEHPGFTATTRLTEGSRSDLVKVVFLVEKSNEEGGQPNVNSRYTVERVDLEGAGLAPSGLSQTIRDEMQTLVGEKLNQEKANQILHEINHELRPKYTAEKKVKKGSDPQHVVVVYEIHKTRLIPYIDIPSNRFVYNSKQNFSMDASFPIDMGRNNRLLLGLNDDQDQLTERFAGFGFGFESTKVGTDRLGLALRYARYHERWQPETVSADKGGIYRGRNTFDPSITFGFDPRLRLNAGVSLSDIQIQYPALHHVNANAATASLVFHNIWGDAAADRHSLEAAYDFRAGTHQLDSGFIYTRHLVSTQYVYMHGNDKLAFSFLGGRISGNAPLFERFSLGNTDTLRGWNKFDVAPAGGNRMIHASVQYGFGKATIGNFDFDTNGLKRTGNVGLGFHVFYDVGAVGDSGSPMVARHSAGVGFGGKTFFMELGVPIRSNNFEPMFSMGFRF